MTNLAKVIYIHGILEGQNKVEPLDEVDETIELCEAIAKDWENFVDIQGYEEEGYIMKYATRKILEGFQVEEMKFNDNEMDAFLKANKEGYERYHGELDFIADHATEMGFVWDERSRVWEKRVIVLGGSKHKKNN